MTVMILDAMGDHRDDVQPSTTTLALHSKDFDKDILGVPYAAVIAGLKDLPPDFIKGIKDYLPQRYHCQSEK